MLEKNLANTKSPIKILIAYDPEDNNTAASCAKIIMNKFNARVNGHPITVTALPFDKLDGEGSYHVVYVLKTNLSQLKKVRNSPSTSGAIMAMYDADKLAESGLLFSIQMERTPVILINAKALRENRFSFPDSLLEMARIIQ